MRRWKRLQSRGSGQGAVPGPSPDACSIDHGLAQAVVLLNLLIAQINCSYVYIYQAGGSSLVVGLSTLGVHVGDSLLIGPPSIADVFLGVGGLLGAGSLQVFHMAVLAFSSLGAAPIHLGG